MLILYAAALLAQDVIAPERFAPARTAIAQMIADGLAPAIAVAVLEDSVITWAEGFGMADREKEHAATADSIFRLASISKPFTATALMRLVEQGDLDLDASVNRYLEGEGVIAYRGAASDITLRRLANHTAGLPTHWSFYYVGSTPPPRAETIARYGFAAWAPGTRSNYSNLAFGILDHVIARTSKRSFREYLVAEVLDPLGMTRSDLGVRPGQEAHAAEGYTASGASGFVPVVDYGFDHDGASAVRSSARDLMRFAAMHLGDGEAGGVRVLRTETARAMRVPEATPPGNSFGVAWSVGTARGTAVVRHTGGMPGVSTALELYPDRRAAIAVLTNCSDRGATQRALAAIQEIMLRPAAPRLPSDRVPTASESAGAGDYRGLVVHHDGAVPVEVNVAASGDVRLLFGTLEVRQFARRQVDDAHLALRCRGPLATTTAFAGTPILDFALDREADGGFAGVLAAIGAATCQVPHWVQLAPVVTKPAETLRAVAVDLAGDAAAPAMPARRVQAAAWLAARDPDLVALAHAGLDQDGLRRLASGWGHAHVALLDATLALTSRTPIELSPPRGVTAGIELEWAGTREQAASAVATRARTLTFVAGAGFAASADLVMRAPPAAEAGWAATHLKVWDLAR